MRKTPAVLNHIAQLPDGWLNGRGRSFDSEQLNLFERGFNYAFADDLPRPCFYPSDVDNCIQLEWSIGNWEVSLLFLLVANTGDYQAVNIVTNAVIEEAVNFNGDGWQRLDRLLRNLIEAGHYAR